MAQLFGWPAVHAVVRNGNDAVTMFFVISQYLVSTDTMRRCGALGRGRLPGFHRARAARILPGLILVLLVVNVLAASGPDIFRNQSESGGPVPLRVVDATSPSFWMNVLMSRAGWLNDVPCVQRSLSVEEVFDLPIPIPILCRLPRRENVLLAAWGVFIAIGPTWRLTHRASEYEELNATLSCLDGIAFGCCAAVLDRRFRLPDRLLRPPKGWTVLAMTAFYLATPIRDTAVYGVSLMALGTAIVLIGRNGVPSAARPDALPGPIRPCGRLSYELYLSTSSCWACSGPSGRRGRPWATRSSCCSPPTWSSPRHWPFS